MPLRDAGGLRELLRGGCSGSFLSRALVRSLTGILVWTVFMVSLPIEATVILTRAAFWAVVSSRLLLDMIVSLVK